MVSLSMADGADPNGWAETRDLTVILCVKNAEPAILFQYLFLGIIIRPSLPYGNAENRSIVASVGRLNAPLLGST